MAAFGQPTEVDPMSGNPVPPGGTPEGVRDDIDAKLSEGEFIIPAHVVRFVGVTQLMQLIQAAEAGIQQMEQGGMMGQPVNDVQGDLPFDPSTLETEEAAEPGVAPSAPGFNKGGLVNESSESAQIPTVAMYRDASGFLRAVPIVNGQPVGVIPEGAQLVSGTPQLSKPKENPRSNGSSMDENDQKPIAYDIDKLTGQEARQMLGGQKAISDFTSSRAGRTTRAVGSMVPGLGQVMSFAASMQQPITNALANRVLEQDYGMKPASLLDNFRGRTTSSDLTLKRGSPTYVLSQMDKERDGEGYSQDDLESADWGGIDDQRENDLGW